MTFLVSFFPSLCSGKKLTKNVLGKSLKKFYYPATFFFILTYPKIHTINSYSEICPRPSQWWGQRPKDRNWDKNVKGNHLQSVYPKTFFVYTVLILQFAPYLGLSTIQSLFLWFLIFMIKFKKSKFSNKENHKIYFFPLPIKYWRDKKIGMIWKLK